MTAEPDPAHISMASGHIAGVGVDIVSIQRIRRSLQKYDQTFVRRVFTKTEQAYCGDRTNPAQHYAARFAAKEAAMKVLGTGWDQGVGWTDISVHRSEGGRPELRIRGQAAAIARRSNIQQFHLSLSHDDGRSIAFCVGEKTE